MHSLLFRVSLGVAVMLSIALRWSTVDAQPAPSAPSTATANQIAEAQKLTQDAIAAEQAGNYTTAIALYQQAYQLMPHPTLVFNIGQVYEFAGNRSEAERYYRVYLMKAPNGPQAAVARQFLASLRLQVPPPPPVQVSPPQTASPTSAQQTGTATSGLARVPEPAPPDATETRITNVPGERRPEQINPISVSQPPDEGKIEPSVSTITPPPSDAQDKLVRRARAYKHAGYAVMGVSAALAIAALAYANNDHRSAVFGASTAAVLLGFGGVGLYAHGVELQHRAARSVAWSPAVGAGFAGVALSGTLP
jgi:tetratricopeptide (TPR) repeat protein